MYRILFAAGITMLFILSCQQNKNTSDKNQPEQHIHDEDHNQNTNEMDVHEHDQKDHSGHDHETEHNTDEHQHSNEKEDHKHSAETAEGKSRENEAQHDHAEAEVHQVTEIHPQNFYDILHVSGKIMPSQKGQSMLAARHAGLVVFDNYRLIEGQKVRKGQKLFLISAKGLTHNNLETKYIEVKNEFERVRQDFERAQKLLKNQIISKSEFQQRKVDYENIKSRFNNIKRNYVKGGQPVYASSDGFISQLYVKEGEYVDIGSPLAAIVEDKRLVIKAEVPQDLVSELSFIKSASFSPAYNEQVFFTDSLNGQLLSIGRSTGESVYTPVFFEIDYQPDLLPGAFVDVFLHARNIDNALVVPQTAILEELNRYYIYKWTGHEFEKHYIKIAGTNGQKVRISRGLSAHDKVATKDVYQIRLSKMSGAMPEHAHNHAH